MKWTSEYACLYSRKRYRAKRVMLLQSAREKRNGNLELFRARARRLYYKHRQKRLVQARAWKALNQEKVKAYLKAYRVAHRDKLKAQTKEWRTNNPDKVKAMKRRWYFKRKP